MSEIIDLIRAILKATMSFLGGNSQSTAAPPPPPPPGPSPSPLWAPFAKGADDPAAAAAASGSPDPAKALPADEHAREPHPDSAPMGVKSALGGQINIPTNEQTTVGATLDRSSGKAPDEAQPKEGIKFTDAVAGIPASFVRAITRIEALDAKPRWDVKQWTVGWGTRAKDKNEKADLPELQKRFTDEVTSAAKAVDKLNPNLDTGTRAALTSLTFNVGDAWKNKSLGDAVKRGDVNAIKQRMLQYNQVSGKEHPVIVARRNEEATWIGKTDLNEPVRTWTLPQSKEANVRVPGGGSMRAAPSVAPAGRQPFTPPDRQSSL